MIAGIGGISPTDWIITGGSSPGERKTMDAELCQCCGEPTGRSGEGEDSIFWLDGQIGPMCEECSRELQDEIEAD